MRLRAIERIKILPGGVARQPSADADRLLHRERMLHVASAEADARPSAPREECELVVAKIEGGFQSSLGRCTPDVRRRGRTYALEHFMHKNKIRIFLHFVWTTWDREPMVIPSVQRRLYRVIEHEVQKCGCNVLAINGMVDHTHVLLRFATTITIAKLVKQMKGVSSYFFNEALQPDAPFKWQAGYGAFSISPSEVDEVIQYIKNQQYHHNQQILRVDLEDYGMFDDE